MGGIVPRLARCPGVSSLLLVRGFRLPDFRLNQAQNPVRQAATVVLRQFLGSLFQISVDTNIDNFFFWHSSICEPEHKKYIDYNKFRYIFTLIL